MAAEVGKLGGRSGAGIAAQMDKENYSEALLTAQERYDRYRRACNSGIRLDNIDGKREIDYVPSRLLQGIIRGEEVLDFWGILPGFSNISAVLRAIFGLEELVFGFLYTTVSTLTFLGAKLAEKVYVYAHKKSQLNEQERIAVEKISSFAQKAFVNSCKGVCIFTHGVSNIVRGIVEFVPFIGNGLAAFYMDQNFRLSYCQEDLPKKDLKRLKLTQS